MSNIILETQAAPSAPSTNQVVIYFKTDGLLYWKDSGGSEYGIATQAQQESGTGLYIVTSLRQQYHPSAAKNWCFNDTTGTISASYNTSSVTDTATGNCTVNFTVAMSSVSFVGVAMIMHQTTTLITQSNENLHASVSTHLIASINTSGTLTDPSRYNSVCFGDQ